MRSNISEFSYGFAVTNEIIEKLGKQSLEAAPLFPNLRDEEKKGYDLEISVIGPPFFLQFKVSEHMVMRSAGEWDEFNKKYYRFKIRRKNWSKQHYLLKKLSNIQPFVYYVAPLFFQPDEFDRAFQSGSIMDESMFVRLTDLDYLRDDDSHCIAFVSQNDWKFCSDRVRGDYESSGEHLLASLLKASQVFKRIPLHVFLESLRKDFVEVFQEEESGREPITQLLLPELAPYYLARNLTHISRAYLGTDIFVLRKRR